jgi:hypothetical protein
MDLDLQCIRSLSTSPNVKKMLPLQKFVDSIGDKQSSQHPKFIVQEIEHPTPISIL